MKRTESGVRLSATDLSHFLSCRHLTALDLAAVNKQRTRPHKKEDPLLELLWKRGLDHEAAYVETLRRDKRQVVDLKGFSSDQSGTALARTLEEIRRGTDVIVQAALALDSWFGYADVLVRIDKPSSLGDWSYEVIDTKLARDTRAGTVLQLGLYSAMLAEIQGVTPERFYVVVPGLDSSTQEKIDFRFDDFGAYFRLMQQDLLTAAATAPDELAGLYYPEPVDHCGICDWRRVCDDKRHVDDHLSLVAFLSRVHRRELESRDIDTLTKLADMAVPVQFKPKRGSRESYERAHHQALVQLQSRTLPKPTFEFRPPEPVKEGIAVEPRGFARLPEPSPGDVFLDLEGDAFADEGGREYLFGIVTAGDAYVPKWAFTASDERLAFEEVMDFIIDRLDRYPDMHVYHYAPYEPSAFKRLMGRHATREADLDRLLRGGRFIDLYGIVRQALWIGVESYSIKRLEPVYGYARDVDLPDASTALRRMELALQLRQPAMVSDEERAVIAGYNRDDCVSTLRLRDWLEIVRRDAEARGIPCPRPPAVPDEPSDEVSEKDQQIVALREQLIDDLPDYTEEVDEEEFDDEEHARWLLAFLLDYHRREEKATWWEFFRLKDLPSDDFYDERQAVAGLEFVERIDHGKLTKDKKPKGSVVDRYRYPEQDMDIESGARLNTAPDGKAFAKFVEVDRINRTIDISKPVKRAEIHPSALFAWDFFPAEEAKGALLRLGERVAAAGTLTAAAPSAAIELLLRNPPRLSSGSFVKGAGESELALAIRAGANLNHSVLAIQGPPGSGKTFTGSEMIVELVRQGKRVGVTANSHKVIRNLLDKVVEKATERRVKLSVGHKNGDDGPDDGEADVVQTFGSNESALTALENGEVDVLGGTAWLWSREEFAEKVDVLFVDEAGQMVLANVLAVSQAANSLVLLGDPQQLDQPQQGTHPDGVAVSALEHLLGGHQTIPAELGVFLPTTWRMSPPLCALTSELYYEGRLHSRAGLENQRLVDAAELSGSGLWCLDVEHDGNRNHSPEEVDAVGALVDRLTSSGAKWQDSDGVQRQVMLNDVLIVTPYNTQVKRLEEKVGPGARIGTVDKFQGQQAPIVIYSMATSRPEDAPRGMEFLYNPNRLNVATSRAQCAVILVASPHLFRPECRTVRQMKLANGLCRFRELATTIGR